MTLNSWAIEGDIENGAAKCVEVANYPGYFADYTGTLHDLRPQDSKPSLANFSRMETAKLQDLLEASLVKQIE